MEVSHQADKRHSGESNSRKKSEKSKSVTQSIQDPVPHLKKKKETKKERDLKRKVTPI